MADTFIATFPGIQQLRRATATASAGISPSSASIEIAPQLNLTTEIGDLAFFYNGRPVMIWRRCKVDQFSFVRDQDGLIWQFHVYDRRHAWANGEISGFYNQHNADETLDEATEKTPQQLAVLLLKAMGEIGYDVSELPNETRPLCEWDKDNPASLLGDLCDSLGCRVVLQLNDRVKLCRMGRGLALPAINAMADSGSLELPNRPDALKLVYAPTVIEATFSLEAVGLDTDGEVKPINSLSYKPSGGWGSEIISATGFHNVSSTAVSVPGRGRQSAQELARQTVFKWYRIYGILPYEPNSQDKSAHDALSILLRPELAFEFRDIRQFLPLLSNILEVDPITGKAYPPYMQGNFSKSIFGQENSGDWDYYLRPFSVQHDTGIVEFSEYVYRWLTTGATATVEAGFMYLTCSFNVRHHELRHPHRHAEGFVLPGPRLGTGTKILKEEGIARTFKINYKTTGSGSTAAAKVDRIDSNVLILKADAQRIFAAALPEFQIKTPQDRTYAGLLPINLDGAIQQVTWTVAESEGATTRASRNTEYSITVPKYKERRMLDRLRVDKTKRLLDVLKRRQEKAR